jgi:hypothetical protein
MFRLWFCILLSLYMRWWVFTARCGPIKISHANLFFVLSTCFGFSVDWRLHQQGTHLVVQSSYCKLFTPYGIAEVQRHTFLSLSSDYREGLASRFGLSALRNIPCTRWTGGCVGRTPRPVLRKGAKSLTFAGNRTPISGCSDLQHISLQIVPGSNAGLKDFNVFSHSYFTW